MESESEPLHPMVYILVIFAAGMAIIGYLAPWLLSAAFIAIIFAILILSYEVEKRFEKTQKEKKNLINNLYIKLDAFSNKLEETKTELSKRMFAIQHRNQEMYKEVSNEFDRSSRELVGKILQVENSLNSLKRYLRYEERA